MKTRLSYLKSASWSLSNCKNNNFKVLDQKCLIWVFLGWNLKIKLLHLNILDCCRLIFRNHRNKCLFTWNIISLHLSIHFSFSRFIETQDSLRYSNLCQKEWRAVRSLADNRSIVIKKADKVSCVVVCDRWDYIKEAEKKTRGKYCL